MLSNQQCEGVVFNQCEKKINGLRNKLAEGGHSKAGEEVMSGQLIRRSFESAVSLIAKSNGTTATKGTVSSRVCKFSRGLKSEREMKVQTTTVTLGWFMY